MRAGLQSEERRKWGEVRKAIHREGCIGGCRFILSSLYSFTFFCTWVGGRVCLVFKCMHEAIPLIHGISLSSTDGREILFIVSWWTLYIMGPSGLWRDQWRVTSLHSHDTQSLGLELHMKQFLIWVINKTKKKKRLSPSIDETHI